MNGDAVLHSPQYSRPAVVLHWLMAIGVMAMVGVAMYMVDLPKGPNRGWWYGMHKSLGLSMALLLLVRLYWRLSHPAPAHPAVWSAFEIRGAQLGHGLLYLFLFLIPVAGYLTSAYTPNPVKFWGLEIPRLVGEDKALNEVWKSIHVFLAYTLVALAIGHAALGVRHLQRGSRRMFGWSAGRNAEQGEPRRHEK